MTPRASRLLIGVAWVLTPVVAWAFSFLGGWLAALAARAVLSEYHAVALLGAGALAGAVVGAAGWIIGVRRFARRAADVADTERSLS